MRQPYPSYQDSGVEWLGAVPSTWGVCKVGLLSHSGMGQTILKEMLEDEPDYDTLPVYSASEGEVEFGHFRSPTVRLAPGDIIIGARGSIGFARRVTRPSTCTQTTIWVKPDRDNVDPGFLYWTMIGGREGLFPFDKTAIPMLTIEHVRIGKICVPPLKEQRAIAAFLDRETGKIDALVAEQRRLIALLKEKRQAVISHAVTKGLDPTAPMKPSGIDWLGDIPEHWELVRLRRLVDPRRRVTYGIVQPGQMDPDGRFMVRGQDYSFGWADPLNIFRVSPEIEEPYRRARLKAGDLVMTIVGAGTGNTAVVPDFIDGANITQTTARIAPRLDLVEGDFLHWSLQSEVGQRQVALYQKGAAQPGLNLEHLVAFRVPVPPKEEQIAISQHIAEAAAKFDSLISEAETAIALLQERRSALISAAVTGKIDVRGLAPGETEAA